MKNYIEEVIKLSIKGGYTPDYDFTIEIPNQIVFTDDGSICLTGEGGKVLGVYRKESIFLDKNFWKCLGKELRWLDYKLGSTHTRGNHADDSSDTEPCYCDQKTWQDYWHSFINHLIAEKEPADFFKELLTKK